LRSIVEELMLEIQFDLPDIGDKGKYVVTEAVVKGEAKLFEKKTATDKKSA
jgi:ATP-dependent protease Clp ATPase subunit